MQAFLAKARARPELIGLASTYRANTQQLRADVDREKTTLLGIPIQDVYSAIQAQFGSLPASQFNQWSHVWWVIVQSDAQFRRDPGDLTRLYTRNNQNQMVPLSSVVTTRWTAGPDILPHFNGFPAAKIIGNNAPDRSSGEAIAVMEEIAKDVLPPGYTFAWSGLAYEEKKSGGTSSIAFVFGLIIVFLVLAAQYESWTLPGAVMTAVPFGILGALVTNWARGLTNDVYFQIGLLVLIGLGAKNAVLRVSAAVEFRKEGKSIMEATILAGEQRLRPIIMTSLAFAMGCLPLALATGAGANARHSIGTGIIGGMIGETTLAMLYVPLFFYLFDRLKERNEKPAAPASAAGPANRRPRRRRPRRTDDARARPRRRVRRPSRGLHDGPELRAPRRRRAAEVPVRDRKAPSTPATPRGGSSSRIRCSTRYVAEALAHNDNIRIAVGQPGAGGRRVHADALAALSAGRLRRGSAARSRSAEPNFAAGDREPHPQSRQRVPGRPVGELGDRLLGAHPAAHRGRARQRARHRRGAPRRDPVAGRGGGDELPAAARARRAARDREADARHVRRIAEALQPAVQVRPDLADERRAGAVAVRDGRRADPADRVADRADADRAVDPARPQSRARSSAARRSTSSRCRDVPAGVPSELLERRPDLRQAEQTLIAANAQIGAAKALYFPTISLTGAFGTASNDLSKLFSGPARVWSYAGQLAGPIFTFGAVSGQVAQAEGARDAALWNYRLSIQNAFGDVDNALIASQKLQGPGCRAGAACRRAAGLFAPRASCSTTRGYVPYSTVLQARADAVPGRADARVRAHVAVRVVGEHLQGDGRRLGRHGGHNERQRRSAAFGRSPGEAAAVLSRLSRSRAPATGRAVGSVDKPWQVR